MEWARNLALGLMESSLQEFNGGRRGKGIINFPDGKVRGLLIQEWDAWGWDSQLV